MGRRRSRAWNQREVGGEHPHHHNTTLNNTAAEGGKAEETMHIHIVITYIILRQTFLLCFDLVLLANYDEYKIFDGI